MPGTQDYFDKLISELENIYIFSIYVYSIYKAIWQV